MPSSMSNERPDCHARLFETLTRRQKDNFFFRVWLLKWELRLGSNCMGLGSPCTPGPI